MLALEVMPEFRLFPIPSIFNFRRATLHPRHGPKLPVILNYPELLLYEKSLSADQKQQKDVDSLDMSTYQSLAVQASYNIFEDCYHDFMSQAGPFDFQCDRLILQ